MSLYALWTTTHYPTGSGIAYSADRLTVNSDASEHFNVFSVPAVTSGQFVFAIQRNAPTVNMGMCDIASVTSSPQNALLFNQDGLVYTQIAGSYTNIFTMPGIATGSWVQFQVAYISGGWVAWITVDGTNFYGAGGTIYTAAQVAAGTGGITLVNFTSPNPFVNYYANGGSVTLNTGSSAYPYTVPIGFGNFPPTLQVPVSPVATVGEPLQVEWADNGITSGINYSENGGSFVAATGFVAGSSGTVTTFTPSSSTFDTVALQNNDLPVDTTETLEVFSFTPPSGSGSLVASYANSAITSGTIFPGNITLAGGPYDKVLYMIVSTYVSGTVASGSVTFFDASSVSMFQLLLEYTSPNTILGYNGPRNAGPTSGPTSVAGVGETVSGFGTLDASSFSGGFAYGPADVSAEGTATTWDAQPWASTLTLPFDTINLNPEPLFGVVGLAIAVWAPVGGPETLTITSASYAAGTLSIGGECDNSTLGTLNISTDNGVVFNPATSLSVSGSIYSAAQNGSLSIGTYLLQAEDAATSVLSNIYTLTVAETLTLATAALNGVGSLSVTGSVTNATLSALDIGVDSTFAAAGSLSISGTNYAATGSMLSAGSHVIQTRDHVTGVLSNTETLVVSGEQITLTTVGGSLGGTLSFGGTTSGGTSTAMDLSVNGTWGTPSAFSGGSPFTGSGGTLATPGVYVVRLRDHTDTYIISNTKTLLVDPVETIDLVSATGTIGQNPALAGTSSGAVPAGLQCSLNGGPFDPTTGYSNDGGSVASPWTAIGTDGLTAGTNTLQVRDSVYTDIVSNIVTITIGGETLSIGSAVYDAGTLTIAGRCIGATLSELNASVEGSAFEPVGSLSISGTAYSAAILDTLSAGTYTVQSQDALTLVESNVFTFTVAGAPSIPALVWPAYPVAQLTLQNIIPSYLYEQYYDDADLQAFVGSYNAMAQQYCDWFNGFGYPVYAGNPNVVGAALDWVAAALYGLFRPVLASGALQLIGAIATDYIGELVIGGTASSGSETVYGTTDDVFKRILTWHLYKADGKQFTIKWLKRRIMRFLYGLNGTDYVIDNTYNVSVQIASGVVTITLINAPVYYATIFQAAVAQGVLELPPFYEWVVNIG